MWPHSEPYNDNKLNKPFKVQQQCSNSCTKSPVSASSQRVCILAHGKTYVKLTTMASFLKQKLTIYSSVLNFKATLSIVMSDLLAGEVF